MIFLSYHPVAMLNIIEHFWQFQPRNIEILPTVLKIGSQPPKAYFYSLKQKRVLRKKEHSVSSAIQVLLGGKQTMETQMLLLTQQKSNQKDIIRPQLILSSQLFQLLSNHDRNCMIISLESDPRIKFLVECQINFDKQTYEVIKKCQWKENQYFWSSQIQKSEVDELMVSRVRKEMMRILAGLIQKMKVVEKCCQFSMLMACDEQFMSLKPIWCNKLQWKSPNFYQLNYQMHSLSLLSDNVKAPIKDHHQKVQIYKDPKVQMHFVSSNTQEKSQQKVEPEKKEEIKTDKKNLQICRGCQTLTVYDELREVTHEQVIALRRKNKLSIMGLNQDYYNICSDCSQQLQNMI